MVYEYFSQDSAASNGLSEIFFQERTLGDGHGASTKIGLGRIHQFPKIVSEQLVPFRTPNDKQDRTLVWNRASNRPGGRTIVGAGGVRRQGLPVSLDAEGVHQNELVVASGRRPGRLRAEARPPNRPGAPTVDHPGHGNASRRWARFGFARSLPPLRPTVFREAARLVSQRSRCLSPIRPTVCRAGNRPAFDGGGGGAGDGALGHGLIPGSKVVKRLPVVVVRNEEVGAAVRHRVREAVVGIDEAAGAEEPTPARADARVVVGVVFVRVVGAASVARVAEVKAVADLVDGYVPCAAAVDGCTDTGPPCIARRPWCPGTISTARP